MIDKKLIIRIYLKHLLFIIIIINYLSINTINTPIYI